MSGNDGGGRPRRPPARDRAKDVAMLEATTKALAVEGLAAEAGVSKVTVYTRWRSKG